MLRSALSVLSYGALWVTSHSGTPQVRLTSPPSIDVIASMFAAVTSWLKKSMPMFEPGTLPVVIGEAVV